MLVLHAGVVRTCEGGPRPNCCIWPGKAPAGAPGGGGIPGRGPPGMPGCIPGVPLGGIMPPGAPGGPIGGWPPKGAPGMGGRAKGGAPTRKYIVRHAAIQKVDYSNSTRGAFSFSKQQASCKSGEDAVICNSDWKHATQLGQVLAEHPDHALRWFVVYRMAATHMKGTRVQRCRIIPPGGPGGGYCIAVCRSLPYTNSFRSIAKLKQDTSASSARTLVCTLRATQRTRIQVETK